MPRSLYPKFRAACLSPGVNLLTDAVKVALVSTTTGGSGGNYVYDAAHEFFSSVPADAIVADGVELSGKALAGASMTASPVVFPAVVRNGSQTGQALIYYIDTGTAGTSRLIGYSDIDGGLPVTPNGEDITVTFSGAVISLN